MVPSTHLAPGPSQRRQLEPPPGCTIIERKKTVSELGSYTWRNPDGSSYVIDVGSLPTTTQKGNCWIPNLGVVREGLPGEGGIYRIAEAIAIYIDPDTLTMYQSILPPDERQGEGIFTMCTGPYPCSKPHPHPDPDAE